MILSEQDKLRLSRFLDLKLPKLSEANPEAIKDYIFTIFTRSESNQEIRKACKKELKDFLRSENFIDEMFDFIEIDLNTKKFDRSSSRERKRKSQTHKKLHKTIDKTQKRDVYRQFDGDNVILTPSESFDFNAKPENTKFYHQNDSNHLKTLYIRNIPQNLSRVAPISNYFEKFGQIVHVQVDPNKKQAFVQFKTHEQARNAIHSTSAVFDNRFIKISWAYFDRPKMFQYKFRRNQLKMKRKPFQNQFKTPKKSDLELAKEKLNLELKQTKEIISKLEEKMKSESEEKSKNRILKMVSKMKEKLNEIETKLEMVSLCESQNGDCVQRSVLDSELEEYRKEDPMFSGLEASDKLLELKMKRFRLVQDIIKENVKNDVNWWKKNEKSVRNAFNKANVYKGSMNLDERTRTLRVSNLPKVLFNEDNARKYFGNFGIITNIKIRENEYLDITFSKRFMSEKLKQKGANCGKYLLQMEWVNDSVDQKMDS